jgi:CRISPR/Cas system-associated exonuclease Cas4 (RecB family)
MLDHYIELEAADQGPLKVRRLEETLIVPIPSRTGRRRSTRYRFLAKIDGYTTDEEGTYGPPGEDWLVEYKRRNRLQPVWLMERARQYRWYAWTYEQLTGRRPIGILIDERLAEVPKEPRTVQGRKKDEGRAPSHAKDQLCRPEDYVALCEEHGVEPHQEVVEHLRARRWQQRVPLQFRTDELDHAGRELVTAAQLIAQLDARKFEPLRNAHQSNCNGCRFREICPTPEDVLTDVLFDRRPPKRSLPEREGH